MENLSLTNESKFINQHSSALHIPVMSETALKRWCDARDAYLGEQYPYVEEQPRIKQKLTATKPGEIVSVCTLEPERIANGNVQPHPFEPQELLNETRIIDDKCVGTETNEAVLLETDIEQIDQAIQVDSQSPQIELHHEYDNSMVEGEMKERTQSTEEAIEYSDKAIETDAILNLEKENEVMQDTTENPEVPVPNVHNQIISFNEPTFVSNDDTKTILSTTESNTSISEQILRLRVRFRRLSKERRLLSCLLLLYIIIMCGLLIVIFLLLWAFQGRPLVSNREVIKSEIGPSDEVARYGESCNNDKECKRPFTCYKKTSSSGICRCPLTYDLVNHQCVGDINALCTKDSDCQRYMLCTGMNDGTRRCQCQTSYDYDIERKHCRGDYHAPCQNNIDCRANLICNKTSGISRCSCSVNYRYYPLEHKCRGNPGALCEQETAECLHNAECRDGACECAYQYIPDKNKICVDPCPRIAPNPVRIRYPGDCRRFIDCQQRSKTECPEMTIFNFRTQLCDYRKNVLDCR